ncbi:MAG: hypothetical protein A2033_13615 [Bacteroidetes bacterium GWA2_31_9]|nr:MAG: hypothetical protein A2033_13615 [Bacteroidetes bacterium GWA2_31_9]
MKSVKFLLIFSILTLSLNTFAQKGKIIGKVIDSKNEPVFMASIVIEGSGIGTATDFDGNYSLEADPGNYTLVFSFIGYTSQKQKAEVIEGKTITMNVTLKEDILMLDEAVVVGYGRRQKRDVTGSIATIKPSDIGDGAVTTVEQTMQGRASGVQITSANGIAGSPMKVNIRGNSSISAGSEPLYVIDGIPVTTGDLSPGSLGSKTSALADLNPADIESIEILKDAASAAIYGSRGSNGVVLISTKKGKEGKTKFSVGYYSGIVNATKKLDFLDAKEHLALRDSVLVWSGQEPESKETEVYSNWTRAQADSLAELGGTDWIDKFIRTGVVQDLNLSATGGNEKTIFYIGGTYHKEKGFLVGNDYERINGRINIENKATNALTIGTNIGLSFSNNKRVPTGDDGGLGWAQQMLPYLPIYNNDGTYFLDNNPVWQLENTHFKASVFRTVSNLFADLKIYKDLSYRSEYGIDVLNQIETEFNFRNIQVENSMSDAWDRRTTVYNWNTNNYFTYNKTIKEHDIIFNLGNSMQHSSTKQVGLHGWNFPNDYFTTPATASEKDGYGYETEFGFVSYFFRANYKLKDKYLATLSIRTDGSSRFGDENKYGWFPALSAGWIISDEKFMESIKQISFLKLRSSYGFTGNANIGDLSYLGYYSINNGYNGQSGISPNTLGNPELSWEKAKQLDLTLEYGIFQNKISGSATYYNKITTDMLMLISLPPSSGYSGIWRNVGKMSNKGFEFTLSTKNLNKAFKWSTDFNISFNKNKVIDVNGLPPDAFESGQPGEGRVVVGYPVGQAYLVEYAGVQKQDGTLYQYDNSGSIIDTFNVVAGTALYYDINGNIMTKDHPTGGDFYTLNRVPKGKPSPDFVGGITNNFSYKNIDFSFLVSFVYGNTLYDDPAKRQLGDYTRIAQRKEVMDAWSPSNPDSDKPAIFNEAVNSDLYLYDASFIRLRSVTIGYRLSEKYCKKFKLGSFRIYISGTNLLTYTKYPGWDPEVLRNVDTNSQAGNISFAGPSFQTPQVKTFTAGIQFTF